jgi:hypothetical protein
VGTLAVDTAAGTGNLSARILDVADPLARGIYRQLSGRAAASTDEVVLTPAAARRVGVGVGGSVRLADGNRSFRVVGVVEDPEALQATTIILRPGALPRQALPDDRQNHRWLVATPGPLTWAQIRQLNTHGLVAVSRHVLAQPPSPAERYPGDTRVALPLELAYAMTKGAVNVMTQTLANALGARGITVNAVAPGPTDTDMTPSWATPRSRRPPPARPR